MPALDMLRARSNKKIIEQKFIDRVLRQEATNIMKAQDRLISRRNVLRIVPEIGRRRFTVTGGRLEFTHPIRQRFIDMRRIKGQKQRAIPLHNKIIYGHFNNVIGRLAFGLTEDVKQLLAGEHNVQL